MPSAYKLTTSLRLPQPLSLSLLTAELTSCLLSTSRPPPPSLSSISFLPRIQLTSSSPCSPPTPPIAPSHHHINPSLATPICRRVAAHPFRPSLPLLLSSSQPPSSHRHTLLRLHRHTLSPLSTNTASSPSPYHQVAASPVPPSFSPLQFTPPPFSVNYRLHLLMPLPARTANTPNFTRRPPSPTAFHHLPFLLLHLSLHPPQSLPIAATLYHLQSPFLFLIPPPPLSFDHCSHFLPSKFRQPPLLSPPLSTTATSPSKPSPSFRRPKLLSPPITAATSNSPSFPFANLSNLSIPASCNLR